MLDAQSDGERLRRHRHPAGSKHRVGVAGTVAHGEHGDADGDAAVAVDDQASQYAAVDLDIGDLALELYRPAGGDDPPPQGGHDRPQLIGAHVGLVQIFYLRRRPGGHQRVQHLAGARIVHPGGQLAVGERAGSAFAELDVRHRIELACPPEAGHVARPCLHVAAALQQDGPVAVLGQRQGGEQAGRTGAHHHRRIIEWPMAGHDRRLRLLGAHGDVAVAGQPGQHLALADIHRYVKCVHEGDIRLAAGINRPPDNRHRRHASGRQAKASCRQKRQRAVVVDRNPEIGYSQQ